MTVEKLNELISSAESKIEKKLSTIGKKKKQIEKKEKELAEVKGKEYVNLLDLVNKLFPI